MLDCLFDIFERYQTFIVGLLGFIGVIYTISTNAALARSQHKREIDQEKITIRTALIEELKLLSNSYNDRIDMFDKDDHKGTAAIPVNVPNDVYLNLLPKIGLLTPKEIKSLMVAYQLADELPIRLDFLAVKDNNAYYNPAYISIDSSNYTHASQMHKNFLTNFEQAISDINNEISA